MSYLGKQQIRLTSGRQIRYSIPSIHHDGTLVSGNVVVGSDGKRFVVAKVAVSKVMKISGCNVWMWSSPDDLPVVVELDHPSTFLISRHSRSVLDIVGDDLDLIGGRSYKVYEESADDVDHSR